MSSDCFFLCSFIVLALGGMACLMASAFSRAGLAYWISLSSYALSLFLALKGEATSMPGAEVLSGFLYADPLSVFSLSLLYGGSLLVTLFAKRQIAKQGVDTPAEFYALMLFATTGAAIFSVAGHMISFFIGLELMSLALYCLCGSAVMKPASSESALKYFLLGSFGSAILLYGFALLFGLSGQLQFGEISAVLGGLDSRLLLVACVLVLTGVLFKVSAFPFHFWTADVYQGAPSVVTAYMASVVKVASFSAAIRVFWLLFGPSVAFWSEFLPGIAVATITIGTLMAIRQTDVKRMLAFSSISHAGYMLLGLLAGASESQGIAALLFYLELYTMTSLGVFAIVGEVSAQRGSSDFHAFKGLASDRPEYGLFLAFFLLCLAGLPPGIAGLVAKIQLFASAVRAEYAWVVVVALLNSAVGLFYYLRLIRTLYVPAETRRHLEMPLGTAITVVICGVAAIVFSFVPGVLLSVCARLSQLL